MTTTIKITELTNIGANLNGNTLVPVVNMNGTPVTQRSNVENLANYVLNTGTGANLGAVGNITITGGNAGEVLSTDGNGVLSWESSGATYSNSNVANYLPTYTGNITGDYIELTHDVNANVVYGNYLYGDGSNITNLPVGNISSINIDGNSSNVLYGNGVFDSIPNPFNQDLNTTDNVTFANITSTDAIRFSNSSNIVGSLGYAPTYVSIEGYGSNAVNITANDVYTWSFGDTGNLNLPVSGDLNFNSGGIVQTPMEDFDIRVQDSDDDGWQLTQTVDAGDGNIWARTRLQRDQYSVNIQGKQWTFNNNGDFNLGGNVQGDYGVDSSIYVTNTGSNGSLELKTISYIGDTLISNVKVGNPNVTISTGNAAYTWTFDGNGVLSIPGSTFTSTSLNTIKGDNGFRFRPSNNSETAGPELYVTYNDGIQIMPLTFDYYTPGNAAAPLIIAGASTNVAGMAPGTISIHGGHNSTDTTRGNVSISVGSNSWVFGNTGVMTLPGGAIVDSSSDNFEVRAIENVNFEANAVVNIYTDGSNNAYQWQFDDNGKLNLAGGGSIIESIANSSLDPTLPNVSTMVFTPDSTYSSQSLVLDPTSPGHIHLRAYAFSNIDEPAANIFLGGENTSFEVTNGANNEARIHSAGNTWTFGNDSTTTVPGHINAITNNSITLNAYDNGAGPTVQMINWNSGSGTPTTIISSEVTEAVITTNVNATPYSWTFDNAGNLTLPGNLIATTASPHMTINGFSFSNSTDYSGSGNISAGGNLTITGTITSTGKIGYSTGGNATQTSTGQGVTINQLTGLVTLANRTYNAGDLEAFSISCNKVSNDDFVLVQMVDSVNAPSYNVVAYPNFVLANTISVLVKTLETVGTDTPILKFMIVKAPIA